MSFASLLRKNIGTIVAVLGFVLLCIVTFGNLEELFGPRYWASVKENLTAISFTSIGLTFIQTAIRQGIAEQALQKGLNTEGTAEKYKEHRNIIKANNDKIMYLPYFLQIYNQRHTKLRRREFLVNNNFSSERNLYLSRKRKLIKAYKKILVHVTIPSIKWSSVDVIYDKHGSIITLDEYRKRRARTAIWTSMFGMVGTTFIAAGLFFSELDEPLWQKLVKLFTYCIVIVITSIFVVIKEYEKGAFGVPNELDEINQIWHEFELWEIPEWVEKEIDELDNKNVNEEVKNGQGSKGTTDIGTDLQTEQKEVEGIYSAVSDNMVPISFVDDCVLLPDNRE